MEKVFHPYHMVNMSPWPLVAGIALMSMMISLVKVFIFFDFFTFKMASILMFLVMFGWWRDVVRESTFQGYHSSMVVSGLMWGMVMFIVSEILFFMSFFWSFFHSSLNPVFELGGIWPPMGVDPLNAFQVPLLNTIILLASGVSVTWAHQALLGEKMMEAKFSLMLTWMLGIYFLFLQFIEYSMSSFGISDSIYGSTFFMATGFHGFHVIVGTFFLMIMWMRVKKSHFSSSHHFGFECSALYWHFVDVVWLFLFSVVYWWGSL